MVAVVGDRTSFAIESAITQAFPNIAQRALGYFVIHIRGKAYGVQKPGASMLGCSFEAVNDRLRRRGTHQVPFLSTIDAPLIAEAYLDAWYRQTARVDYFGLPAADFTEILHGNAIVWAPDGDESFDDGSHILQFDVGHQVRLIASAHAESPEDVGGTVVEKWLDDEVFYSVLSRWSEQFAAEWANKSNENSASSVSN
ncbi:Imm42 family immunity protein [Mesorhizobium sp. NZP2077]|uniref:Imm42 family immunity protein n=1 Tax=Mesorhizobium sp. NZP2077 TaxID=2483404 RepID=UPI001551C7AF|nr:Imm42 family immunity protein [Mesorhizobium sp. NZP2077]QKC82377.1 hypothetical protein EB232_12735 [Mesorhizobium sp. NZP2077]QKD15856.1 hypothetical protein HGP13_12555 [Mesorhizobium sp. NZP2077]